MNPTTPILKRTKAAAKFDIFLSIVRYTLIGAVIWGSLFIGFGYYTEAAFPLTFAIILGLGYYLRGQIVTNKHLTILYTTLIFILPISLQVMMGGIHESGFVGIWAVLSPMAALLFLRYVDARRLFILFVAALIAVIVYEMTLLKDGNINNSIGTFLLVANVITINIICFLTFSFFSGQMVLSKKEIHSQTDTLNTGLDYAKTVQRSLINSNLGGLQKRFTFFIYCKPKQVVCGDFVWSNTSSDNITHLAVADCAGHGIAAAFLSILGSTFLDEIILTNKTTNPSDILSELSDHLREKQKTNHSKFKDFLIDMTILKIDPNNNIIEYSCANTTILKFTNEKLELIESETKSLGSSKTPNYSTETLKTSKGDKIYLSSNGIKKQLNAQGKALGTDGYVKIIDQIKTSTIVAQEIQFNNKINDWMKDAEVSDDLLVVGIKA